MVKQSRGAGRRNKVRYSSYKIQLRNGRNSFKCGTFRRWLIETYGWEFLKKFNNLLYLLILDFRSPILDVAGGKGEMSFELVNLAGLSCTVVDPRPMSLHHAEKRLKAGIFHRFFLER